MFSVGRLGSYISRGVNTVSGPFQGGAVDIIVVEQPDGSFKSSPWYVRVGKSQGALKVDERIVRINVNGVDADFCMYLDNKGDAVFLCQVEDGEGESENYPSSGDDLDPKSKLWRNPKSKSCNFDANRTDLVEFEASKGKIVPRTNSPRARYLEHAEMAANLLEVRWTTNLASSNSNIASNASDCQKSKEIYEDIPCSTNPGHMDASSEQETYNGAEIFPHSSENASCNGKEKSSCNAAKVQLQDNIGRHPVRSGSEECLGDCSRARNASVRPTEISEDEQFSFSDLDEPKDEKVKGKGGLVSDGWKECLTIDLSKSSDEKLTETVTTDDELIHTTAEVKHNSTSSPISISKAHKNVDLEFCPPIVESLPNLPFAGDNINPDGIPDLLSRSLDSNFEALKMVDNDVQMLSELGSKQQVAPVQPKTNGSHVSEEIKKIISDPAVEVSLCRHLLHEGMGYEAAALAFDSEKLDVQRFSSLCPDIVKDDKLVVRIGGLYFPWDAALPIASTIGSNEREHILEPKGMIAVGQSDKTSPVVPQKSVNTRNGSWKIWPFSFRRSHSVEDKNLGPETASQNPSQKDGSEEVAGFGVMKKKKRAKAPTSEQLLSLNLKEGKNVVTFTVSTATQGNQQVEARIFLWNWNSRIVISDVDGTITKSDVLGQFMPLMGYDWSQTGVTRLFSAIKENGYHLLFLSARSILQAYHTRQFLVSLTQDGKALPEGPVVISPDGIFPSLYREVIRRAPHEFKIACLEDIRALFPQDHNPFYAGFGNRDTDEFSYLKVGIPRGKIFTINPKGQIVVNRRVDTKSYTSLHELVHDMFPPAPATEQEDYNNWNFWRLPLPDVGI